MNTDKKGVTADELFPPPITRHPPRFPLPHPCLSVCIRGPFSFLCDWAQFIFRFPLLPPPSSLHPPRFSVPILLVKATR